VWRAIIILMLVGTATQAQGPAAAIVAAAVDVQSLPVAVRQHVRYLELTDLLPEERRDFLPILAYHVNSLSRELDLLPLTVVNADLVRLNLCDYGISPKTWERLADADPLLHVRLVREEIQYQNWGYYQGSSWVTTERRKTGVKKVIVGALAPWLTETPQQQQALAYLVQETQSQAPVVNALWFFHQSVIQEGRDGTRTGYYDFLGLGKKEADWLELVGGKGVIDQARKLKLELGAAVRRSRRVAIANRQIRRVQSLTGGLWLTIDVNTSVGERNALRNLLDLKADVTEQIAVLPNGLPAFWLADGQGNRQNSAPDSIAGNTAHRGVDTRVHAGPLTCLICHRTVLHPIQDYVRDVLARPPMALASPDPDVNKRLRQLYLSDLETRFRRDVEDYATAAARATGGLKLEEVADRYGRFWDLYEADRTVERISRGVGVPAERILQALRAQQTAGTLDPVLAGLLHGEPLRFEHYEESLPTLHVYLRGLP